MRTSELAARAGVNPQTLRYYERRGLLAAPVRSPGGYRAYPDAAVRRVRFIKQVVDLRRRIADLQVLQAGLARLVATCDLPRGQRECPVLHELDPGVDGASTHGQRGRADT